MHSHEHRSPFRYAGAYAVCLLLALTLSMGCADTTPSPTRRVAEGKRLMQRYCGTCHLSVPATALDKKTWLNHVLPVMAPKLGVKVFMRKQYFPGDDIILPFSDWKKIVEYFGRTAPDTLRLPTGSPSIRRDLSLFSVKEPQWNRDLHNVATTAMVAVDPFTHQIYSSHVAAENVYRWNEALKPTAVAGLTFPAVHVSFVKDSTGARHGVFTSIGTMRAVNVASGAVWDVNLTTGSMRKIAGELPRPVCALPGDFNRDGRRDWIICGFGHDVGGLYLFVQQADHTYRKKTIRGVPGAIDAHVNDFNHDGWLDIMVLFAHGNEGVWMFINDKKGGFISKNILRFLPVYGSTSFQLADFNGDGAPDLLYTSGDNADYSDILKPYHGIYIFINQGNYQYEQVYFYPLPGTTKAIAADFDEDDDLDISAIAFFADLTREAPKTFVYLKQDQPLQFHAYIPPIQQYGRWISMAAGDYDGDADLDLVLGNYSRGFLSQERIETTWDAYTPLIVLVNNTYSPPAPASDSAR